MKTILLVALIVIVASVDTVAVPIGQLGLERVPQRFYESRQDECHLSYYNTCSGWAYYWTGYCWGQFNGAPEPPSWGTCFDLSDCPSHCRHLGEVWFAAYRFHFRGFADVEVYRADANSCPIGPPIAGVYGYVWDPSIPWDRVDFGGVPLCPIEEQGGGRFLVLITQHCGPIMGCSFAPFSDLPPWNIEAGCESEWRCLGHSFVYGNSVSYCDVYGAPAPVWLGGVGYGCTDYPTIPPGCAYQRGCFAEWLIDCYVSCQGPTKTEQKSWSEIKALYK